MVLPTQASLEFIAAAISPPLHKEFYDVVVQKAYFPSEGYERFMDANPDAYAVAMQVAQSLSADQIELLRTRLRA